MVGSQGKYNRWPLGINACISQTFRGRGPNFRVDSLHTFCARREVVICATITMHAGKEDLNKGYWNPKGKLGVTPHFSEIPGLRKKQPYIAIRIFY